MARSETSRLYDNIGRRIRHLREDLMTTEDEFKRKGIERNIKSLDDFREDLRKLASKNDNKKLDITSMAIDTGYNKNEIKKSLQKQTS